MIDDVATAWRDVIASSYLSTLFSVDFAHRNFNGSINFFCGDLPYVLKNDRNVFRVPPINFARMDGKVSPVSRQLVIHDRRLSVHNDVLLIKEKGPKGGEGKFKSDTNFSGPLATPIIGFGVVFTIALVIGGLLFWLVEWWRNIRTYWFGSALWLIVLLIVFILIRSLIHLAPLTLPQ